MPESTPENLRKEVERSLREIEKTKVRHTPKQALVSLNIHASALPLEAVDPQRFYADINGRFGAKFDDSSIRESLPPEVIGRIDPGSLLSLALQKRKPVQFTGGVLRLESISRITTIENMAVADQNIIAAVYGTTEEAMLLCKQLALSLWEAAGVNRRWEDVAPFVEATSYKTTTISDLGFALRDILAASVNGFLFNEIDSIEGLGGQMGLRPTRTGSRRSEDQGYLSITHCRKIELKISKFDRVSGRSEDCDLTFLINARTDANRSSTLVASELPIDEHLTLIDKLVHSVNLGLQGAPTPNTGHQADG